MRRHSLDKLMCSFSSPESFVLVFFFFSSRRRHTRYIGDWSSDVCSSDLHPLANSAPDVGSYKRRISERMVLLPAPLAPRSEERRVGKECGGRQPRDRDKGQNGHFSAMDHALDNRPHAIDLSLAATLLHDH